MIRAYTNQNITKKALHSNAAQQSSLPPQAAAQQEAQAASALQQFTGIFENYPDLKADTTMQDLMHRTRDLEDEIALMREGYNLAVEVYNTRIHRIPDLLLARIGHFQSKDFFKI